MGRSDAVWRSCLVVSLISMAPSPSAGVGRFGFGGIGQGVSGRGAGWAGVRWCAAEILGVRAMHSIWIGPSSVPLHGEKEPTAPEEGDVNVARRFDPLYAHWQFAFPKFAFRSLRRSRVTARSLAIANYGNPVIGHMNSRDAVTRYQENPHVEDQVRLAFRFIRSWPRLMCGLDPTY